ncbi:hypothetical protein [Reinekea thalattae]|uniref:Uncharacterized protein n=1 Tax=Reinekea thalattae TaxID=2593301 RepID=A0A5C8Z7R1_9GAMM|nr:hypothetical protein [Reinekea thalattae]TXR53359.1 hypothetical protein FME95_01955 [Reinekea thalattae]
MNIPTFIAFEMTDIESGYPYAVSWSLKDGQYKTVLIRPEEEWLIDFETAQFNSDTPSVQDLLDKGESVLDILKEWDLDLEDGELYCQDPISTQYCLDLMFEAYQKECEYDVISEYDCFDNIDSFDLDEQRRWIMDTEGLSATNSEDIIKASIFLYARTE